MTVPLLSISNTLEPALRSSDVMSVFTHCKSIDVMIAAWTLGSMAWVG